MYDNIPSYTLSHIIHHNEHNTSKTIFFVEDFLLKMLVLSCCHHWIIREAILYQYCSFFNIVQREGGIKPMFKNFVANILLF